jgi:hypothetical protein
MLTAMPTNTSWMHDTDDWESVSLIVTLYV